MSTQLCKVLIVEDEYLLRQGIRNMIDWEQEGYLIIGEASNGVEALQVIEEQVPHIVITDIVMPIMNGIELSSILSKRYPMIQMIVLSGHDDFAYVKKTLMNGAVDYILKTALAPDILIEVLHKAAGNVDGLQINQQQVDNEGQHIKRYMEGYLQELPVEHMKEALPYAIHRLICVDVHNSQKKDKKDVRKLIELIESYISEFDRIRYLQYMMNDHILCFVINIRNRDKQSLITSASKIFQKVNLYNDSLFFVISEEFTDLTEIRNIYKDQIEKILDKKFYFPAQIWVESKAVYELMHNDESKMNIESYTELLNLKEYGEAFRQYKEYILDSCKHRMEEHKLKNQAKNLLYAFLTELSKNDVNTDAILYEYFRKIETATDVGMFQQVMEQLEEQISQLKEMHLSIDDLRIKEIRDYIHENYAQPLDLKQTAKQFGFGYTYLSTIFTSYIESGFNGYLNETRIKKACELLKYHPDTVSEISVKVGYSDHSYFCKVFKKITGMTPRQYRKQSKIT